VVGRGGYEVHRSCISRSTNSSFISFPNTSALTCLMNSEISDLHGFSVLARTRPPPAESSLSLKSDDAEGIRDSDDPCEGPRDGYFCNSELLCCFWDSLLSRCSCHFRVLISSALSGDTRWVSRRN
jgi:hypothetical protein